MYIFLHLCVYNKRVFTKRVSMTKCIENRISFTDQVFLNSLSGPALRACVFYAHKQLCIHR